MCERVNLKPEYVYRCDMHNVPESFLKETGGVNRYEPIGFRKPYGAIERFEPIGEPVFVEDIIGGGEERNDRNPGLEHVPDDGAVQNNEAELSEGDSERTVDRGPAV